MKNDKEALRHACNAILIPSAHFNWPLVVESLKRVIDGAGIVHRSFNDFIDLWELNIKTTNVRPNKDFEAFRDVERVIAKNYLELFSDNKVTKLMIGDGAKDQYIDPRLFASALLVSANFKVPGSFLYEVGNLLVNGWTQANTAAYILADNIYFEAAVSFLNSSAALHHCPMSNHQVNKNETAYHHLVNTLFFYNRDRPEEEQTSQQFSVNSSAHVVVPHLFFGPTNFNRNREPLKTISVTFNQLPSGITVYAELELTTGGYNAVLWGRGNSLANSRTVDYLVNKDVLRGLTRAALMAHGYNLTARVPAYGEEELVESCFIPFVEINPHTGWFYFD